MLVEFLSVSFCKLHTRSMTFRLAIRAMHAKCVNKRNTKHCNEADSILDAFLYKFAM